MKTLSKAATIILIGTILFLCLFSNSFETVIPEIATNTNIEIDGVEYLEIKDINLYLPIYPINDPRNSIEFGIQKLEYSNEDIIYLAAHSGTSSISVFKDLRKLKINSVASIYLADKITDYKLARIEKHPKTGRLNLNIKDINLILITCYGTKEQIVLFYK